jgi:hypothetical protein
MIIGRREVFMKRDSRVVHSLNEFQQRYLPKDVEAVEQERLRRLADSNPEEYGRELARKCFDKLSINKV